MSRGSDAHPWNQRRFPRVSGDEPALSVRYEIEGEFSPRERG